jgi:hypothetical protein
MRVVAYELQLSVALVALAEVLGYPVGRVRWRKTTLHERPLTRVFDARLGAALTFGGENINVTSGSVEMVRACSCVCAQRLATPLPSPGTTGRAV